jgi:hypothetical protein
LSADRERNVKRQVIVEASEPEVDPPGDRLDGIRHMRRLSMVYTGFSADAAQIHDVAMNSPGVPERNGRGDWCGVD